jgi:hypothetical protein
MSLAKQILITHNYHSVYPILNTFYYNRSASHAYHATKKELYHINTVCDFAKHNGERQTPKLAIYFMGKPYNTNSSKDNYYHPIPNSRLLYTAIKQRMHLDIQYTVKWTSDSYFTFLTEFYSF